MAEKDAGIIVKLGKVDRSDQSPKKEHVLVLVGWGGVVAEDGQRKEENIIASGY